MPSCSECHMLIDGSCTAHTVAKEVLERDISPPPLGACMIPIVESYLTLITPGMHVLEVGCGTWDRIQKHCQEIGAHYEAIDAQEEYMGRKSLATRVENLADLSFPDAQFDVVVGNQTMEHWAEYGCTLRWGLYQCFRACKMGGRVAMNVPIHFHGTREFILGKIDVLQDAFAAFSSQVRFEKWGEPSDPLPELYPYPGYWPNHDKPAYVLDVQAIKDRELPKGYNNKGAATGRWAQIRNFPFSFNIYRVFRKLKVLR